MLPTILRQDTDLFDSVFGDLFSDSYQPVSGFPQIDIYEEGSKLFLEASVAGFDKKDIKITVKENVLTITGEKKLSANKEERTFFKRERLTESFQRSFRLPKNAKTTEIKAETKDGLLKVTIEQETKEENVAEIEIK